MRMRPFVFSSSIMSRFKWKVVLLLFIPLTVAVGMANVSSWRPRRVRVVGRPFQVAFSPDGSRVALGVQPLRTVGGMGRVMEWNLGAPTWFRQPSVGQQQTFEDKYPSSICFSNDSRILICIDYADYFGDDKYKTIHRWNLETGQAETPLRSRDGDTARFAHIAPDTGNVTFWTGKSVEQRDAGSGQVKKHVKLSKEDSEETPYELLAFAPDGHTTAWPVSGGTGALILRDVSGHKSRLPALIPHSDSIQCTVTALTFSPNSQFLVVGWSADVYSANGNDSVSSRVTIWDLKTRRISAKWTEAREAINAHAFSPDGSILAAARGDGTISLREARNGHSLRNLKIVGDNTLSVAFSPDGRTLANCGSDGALYLWRVK
ncbi:hypothetical protein IAD21_03394 [Abditibacteriota bacterium]|nr:hypothetical protein IAD21_03394 [Abditibacteriota bacterium]